MSIIEGSGKFICFIHNFETVDLEKGLRRERQTILAPSIETMGIASAPIIILGQTNIEVTASVVVPILTFLKIARASLIVQTENIIPMTASIALKNTEPQKIEMEIVNPVITVKKINKTLKVLTAITETLDILAKIRTAKTVGYQSTKNIDVSKTKSYKKLEQIEKDLNKKLEKIFASIMTQAEIYNKTIDQLKRENNARIKQTVREAIQSAYITGSNYVTKTNKTNQIPVFITERDIENIRKHTDTFVAALWRKVETTIQQRQSEKMFPPTTLQGKPTTPLEKGTISIPIPFQDTPATATAVDSGTPSDLLPPASSTTAAAAAAAATALTTTMLNNALHEAVRSKLVQTKQQQLTETTRKLMWITEHDDKVCPICAALDGQTWDEDDPSMKTPGPDDSHYNCRCMLKLVDSEGYILSDE